MIRDHYEIRVCPTEKGKYWAAVFETDIAKTAELYHTRDLDTAYDAFIVANNWVARCLQVEADAAMLEKHYA